MDSSPTKRRKTSPTTSLPIEAPATPSRISRGEERYPSFASPTKASLSRHNPQLLRRPASSGTDAERPRSRGNPLAGTGEQALGQDVQARGFGANVLEARSLHPSVEDEQDSGLRKIRAVSQPLTSRNSQTIGGGISARPRRLSKSPAKRTERRTQAGAPIVDENIQPFQKGGLRRSPHRSQDEDAARDPGGENETGNIFNDISNPFQKTGLRRSPILSLARDPVVPQPAEERQSDNISERPQTSEVQEGVIKRRSPQLSEASNAVAPAELEGGERSEEVAPEQMQRPAPPESVTSRHSQQRSISPTPAPRRPRSVVPQVEDQVLPATSRIQEEPELPLTPTQRGLEDPVVTTPPSGIHNTPSKKARRNKKLAEKLKSSPLKPIPERPAKEPRGETRAGNPFKPRRSARFLVPEDPNAAKRKARDDLLKELQQLQADVALANQENERLRLQYKSRKSSSSKPPNPEELLALLLRSTTPDKQPEPKPKAKSCVKNIRSFLPFSSRRKPQGAVLPISDKPLPSHLPIALDNPLPYLQAFTPLTFTSNITLLPITPGSSVGDESIVTEAPIMQRHQITARSPSGLFAAHLVMTVNTSTSSVTSIELEKLDLNAEAELGTFIKKRISDDEKDYTLGRDIGVLCWAMGRWVEVSIVRARFWCTIFHELGNPEARKKNIERALTKRKRKRAVAIDDDLAADLAEESEETRKLKWTRKQLLPYMGRTAMEIADEDNGVEVRFEWKVEFDWTGEVESVVSASARMPESWQEEDERRSLVRVPETFDRMVKERGPLGAVRALVGLLMPPA